MSRRLFCFVQSFFLTALANFHFFWKQNKLIILSTILASASAFAPAPAFRPSTAVFNQKADWEKAAELGWSMGGEDYTRDVKPQVNEDPRKSIAKGESFEEYMRSRQQQQ